MDSSSNSEDAYLSKLDLVDSVSHASLYTCYDYSEENCFLFFAQIQRKNSKLHNNSYYARRLSATSKVTSSRDCLIRNPGLVRNPLSWGHSMVNVWQEIICNMGKK